MKVRCLILGFVVLACSSSVSLAAEEVDFEITADYFGKYIWRGQNLSDDSVFQPGLSIGYSNLTAGIWGNMDLTNINGNSGDFSEVVGKVYCLLRMLHNCGGIRGQDIFVLPNA